MATHPKDTPDHKISPAMPVFQRLIAVLFFAVFGTATVFIGWRYHHNVSQSFAARDWVEVPATVTQWDTARTHSTGSRGRSITMEKMEVSYNYLWQGQPHTAHRGGFATGFDNFSDAHRAAIRTKARARNTTAFVNPDAPDQAVLVRDLPWEQTLFYAVFLLFPCGVVTLSAVSMLLYVGPRSTRTARMGWGMNLWAVAHGATVVPIIVLSGSSITALAWIPILILLAVGGAGLAVMIRKFVRGGVV